MGEGSASRPGRSLPPGKTRYPLYRRLGGPQGRCGQVRKISPPPGFDPRTCAQDSALAPYEEGQKGRRGSNIFGPYIPYGLFQTKREMCAKFGSDRFRNVDLYKVQTNKQTNKQTNTNIKPFQLYTVCPRRNVPDFGRVFLMLKYIDITQNTYVQS